VRLGGVDIGIADESDIEELARVEIESKLRSIPEHVDSIEVDLDRRRHRWRTYFRGGSPPTSLKERVVFKAVAGQAIVGFLAGHLTRRFGKDAELELLYVLKSHQRHGIGTALLDGFREWLTAHGARSLCVDIAPGNPYQAFYLKHGGVHLNPHWIVWDDVTRDWTPDDNVRPVEIAK
jgi:GNAT superfamily N-acetyltransferase